MGDIARDIKQNDMLVFVIPDGSYRINLVKVLKAIGKVRNKICYISLNKPCTSLIGEFDKNGIECKKFIFIDCVSKGGESKEGVFYVSSPRALTELNITINKVLAEKGVDSSLFDSLSTLMIYEQPSTVIKFAHSMISAFRNKGVKAVFTCLSGDMESDLIKDLNMFVDKVVELE